MEPLSFPPIKKRFSFLNIEGCVARCKLAGADVEFLTDQRDAFHNAVGCTKLSQMSFSGAFSDNSYFQRQSGRFSDSSYAAYCLVVWQAERKQNVLWCRPLPPCARFACHRNAVWVVGSTHVNRCDERFKQVGIYSMRFLSDDTFDAVASRSFVGVGDGESRWQGVDGQLESSG